MSNDDPTRNDPTPRRLDEAELRDNAEYIEEIGDETEDREVVEENLEQYGFDRMGEGFFENAPTADSDNPDWMNENAKERSNADHPHNENPDGMYGDEESTP